MYGSVIKKDYDTYSPGKKIKIQLAKRSVFNLGLDVVEKIRKSPKINEYGKEVIKCRTKQSTRKNLVV